MSKINRVDYEIMATQAKKLREHGMQLNTEITKAYSNLESMHDCWYGKRYNELLTKFNQIIPQLNTILELVVGKLPYALEKIANNYSIVDKRQNETLANNEEPNRIKELAMTEDTGMRFISEKVIDMQQEISRCFERAKEQLDKIEIEYSKILWKSESAEMFEQKFGELKSEITSFIENIKIEFKNVIAETENDIRTVEKVNNIG